VAQDGEALDIEHRDCPWWSVRVWRERAETPSPARMLAPGRKIHHGAWVGTSPSQAMPGSAFYPLAQGFYIV
jgi:hypothetical protein